MAFEHSAALPSGHSHGASFAQAAGAAGMSGAAPGEASTASSGFLGLLAQLIGASGASAPAANGPMQQELDLTVLPGEALDELAASEMLDSAAPSDWLSMMLPTLYGSADAGPEMALEPGAIDALDAPIEINAHDFMDVDLDSIVTLELVEMAADEASDPLSQAAALNAVDEASASADAPVDARATDLQLHGVSHSATSHTQDVSPSRELRAPFGTPAWTEELGTQLTWMARQGQESASLRISPQHLGPIEVSIDFKDGEASVWFGATHADTRAVLEEALPRLRELFAEQGLTLADSGVSREAPREQGRASAGEAGAQEPLSAEDRPADVQTHMARLGLVDTYA